MLLLCFVVGRLAFGVWRLASPPLSSSPFVIGVTVVTVVIVVIVVIVVVVVVAISQLKPSLWLVVMTQFVVCRLSSPPASSTAFVIVVLAGTIVCCLVAFVVVVVVRGIAAVVTWFTHAQDGDEGGKLALVTCARCRRRTTR